VRAIAGSLGWDYVELHASHFVVAELWEARKIMYFVATNHIEYFDRAVTRSQRYDAIIFMSPPSFDAKKRELVRILRETHNFRRKITFAVDKQDVETAKPDTLFAPISKEPDKGKRDILKAESIKAPHVLFKFALLRFDELGELALHLRSKLGRRSVVTKKVVEENLCEMKDASWRNLGEYDRYLCDPGYERRTSPRTVPEWWSILRTSACFLWLSDSVLVIGKKNW